MASSVGAQVAYASILEKKHVVMLNVEADVVVGPILRRLADAAGVVYTLAAGDQPGAICEMYEWAVGLGLRVVAKGHPTMYNSFRAEVARAQNLLPFGFAYEAKLTADVKKEEAVRWDQVQVDGDSFLLKLRRLQDSEIPL